MARGDLVRVTYRTPTGTGLETITATKDGAKVEVIEPRGNEPYLKIEEQNRNGVAQRTFLFAKGEVLAVVTGHEPIARARKAKAK